MRQFIFQPYANRTILLFYTLGLNVRTHGAHIQRDTNGANIRRKHIHERCATNGAMPTSRARGGAPASVSLSADPLFALRARLSGTRWEWLAQIQPQIQPPSSGSIGVSDVRPTYAIEGEFTSR